LENIFSAQRLDRLFEESAVRQYSRRLLFSTCADLLSLVVLKSQKALNTVYAARKKELAVSVNALYDKIAGIETQVSERMVRDTATDLAAVVDELEASVPGPLPGFDVRILDGNHLAGTDHRLAELRLRGAAALPGQTLCVLDPQRKLLLDVVTCEDGHANERTLIPAILQRVRKKQCWIADSAFCTMDFMFGMRKRAAYFLVRKHGGLKGEPQGKRKRIGRGSTGWVYEQALLIRKACGSATTVRCLIIVRDKPTSKGETEVHLLTNLPAKVKATKATEAYLDRWNIEQAFQELTTTLKCEIDTLGYPKAALFGFCLALVMYNVVGAVRAALRVAGKGTAQQRERLSTYYLADEISGVSRGMEIAVPETTWEETFAMLTPRQLAAKLKWLAAKVDLGRFQTNRWTPKKPQPKRISGNRGNHVSTFQILQQQAQRLARARSHAKTRPLAKK
jgi:IS4 transposase